MWWRITGLLILLCVTAQAFTEPDSVPRLLGDYSQIREIRLNKLAQEKTGLRMQLVTIEDDTLGGTFTGSEKEMLQYRSGDRDLQQSIHTIVEITFYPGKVEIFIVSAAALMGGAFGAGTISILQPDTQIGSYLVATLTGSAVAGFWANRTFRRPEVIKFE